LRNFLKNKYFWLVIIVIVGTLLVMHITSSQRNDISLLEKIIRDAYTPLQSGVVEFKDRLGNINIFFSSKKEMLMEIEELTERNSKLELKNQILRQESAEVQRLRDLLNFKDISVNKYEMVPARVIARSPNNWYRNIVIDKGMNDGIQKNMAVMSPNGLVGRVASVSKDSAYVDLITHREIAVGAIIQESRETQGIIEGLGNSNLLRLANIPYYSAVQAGDHVVTSGLSEFYPKGIDIGVIKDVKSEPEGLLLSAMVEPSVEFDKLEEVLVVIAYYPEEELSADGIVEEIER